MESYKKLNLELIKQVEEYKRRQRLYELQNMQKMQESLIHQRIIRDQKIVIESFVSQNTQDLNKFLNLLVSGHQQNLSAVAQFVQSMLTKFENLLMNISADNVAYRGPQEAVTTQRAPQVVTEPEAAVVEAPKVTVRARRAHRSLSPVAMGSRGGDEEEESPLFRRTNADEAAAKEDVPVESFVTKRRRNYSPRTSEAAEEEEEVTRTEEVVKTVVPPCEPVTLSDGMLSTIPETSQDDLSVLQEQEDEDSSEGEEQESDEEEEDQPENVNTNDEPGDVVEEEEQVDPEPDQDQENNTIPEICIDEVPAIASSTPNPRKRMLTARSVLSPVDTNRVEARVKRTRAVNKGSKKAPAAKQILGEEDEEQHQDISMSLRPRRRAAPQTLAEPSLKDKLRR